MRLIESNDPVMLDKLRKILLEQSHELKGLRVFQTEIGIKAIHAIEGTEHGWLRHVSVSHPTRYPTWDEMRDIKYELFARDEDAMMILPRSSGGPRYVNLHKNCFHLWQLPVIPGRSGKWEVE